MIYDGFPKLKVLFTSSSALDLYHGESDLSRRLITLNLEGLSFREYLNLTSENNFEKVELVDILTNHQELSRVITTDFHPLPEFKSYLKQGYFPAIAQVEGSSMKMRTFQTINTVLETDLAFSKEYSPANITKIKNLLGVIAVTVPFEPNISKIAEKLGISRNTVYAFLTHLQDAKILNLANKPNKGISHLQKPDKIYFENTNFTFSLQESPSVGTIRETFFLNQLKNSGHTVNLSTQGNFLIDEKWIFEIGGLSKDGSQLKSLANGFLALGEMEIGFAKKIPLWLFGFLY